MGIVKMSKLGEASRGVATAASSHRVVYRVANGGRLKAIVASSIANQLVMSGQQLDGQVRVVAYIGEPAPDGAVTVFGVTDVGARVIADVHIGQAAFGGAPSWIPLSWELNGGETVTVEVTNGNDGSGVAFDANVGVNLLGEEHNGHLRASV